VSWLEKYRAPVIGLLIAVILVGGAVYLYRLFSMPHSAEITISPPSPEISVYVEGEVVNPGVYVLDQGALISDAIEVAGGFTSDADQSSVNLSATPKDGMQIHVYRAGEVPQKVNINIAEVWLLEPLPGIGETLAQRIVDYRIANGYFQSIDDLKQVDGIGASVFEKIKDKITVR
jgi:competence protein ComEA